MLDQHRADLAWLTAHCQAASGIPRTALTRLRRVADRLARAGHDGSLAGITERTALLRLLVRSCGRAPVSATLARHARRRSMAMSLAIVAVEADLLVGALAAYRGCRTHTARRIAAAVRGLRQVPVIHPDRQRLSVVLAHLAAD